MIAAGGCSPFGVTEPSDAGAAPDVRNDVRSDDAAARTCVPMVMVPDVLAAPGTVEQSDGVEAISRSSDGPTTKMRASVNVGQKFGFYFFHVEPPSEEWCARLGFTVSYPQPPMDILEGPSLRATQNSDQVSFQVTSTLELRLANNGPNPFRLGTLTPGTPYDVVIELDRALGAPASGSYRITLNHVFAAGGPLVADLGKSFDVRMGITYAAGAGVIDLANVSFVLGHY